MYSDKVNTTNTKQRSWHKLRGEAHRWALNAPLGPDAREQGQSRAAKRAEPPIVYEAWEIHEAKGEQGMYSPSEGKSRPQR